MFRILEKYETGLRDYAKRKISTKMKNFVSLQ